MLSSAPALLPEPWRVKVIEPIHLPSREERDHHLREAGFNLFAIPSEAVFIDLLTDSGTSAQSDRQWAGLVSGDEAYAGSRNYFHFEQVVQEVFGFPHVVPVHQGRAGERLLFQELVHPGMVVPNNRHFDTTQANIASRGAIPQDLVISQALDPSAELPFKGNIDLVRLEEVLSTEGERVPLVILTLTNNAGGGQPVSLANVRATSVLCRRFGVPLWIDACRFAENAYFVREREAEHRGRKVADVAREIFDLADGCLMSAKKDGLANIGGFIATRDGDLARRLRQQMVVSEGFATYGGLAGRDLEAIAVGLHEVLEEEYLEFRVRQVQWFGERLIEAGIPMIRPVGGHAVYLDAAALLPHLSREQLPGQALAVALYRHGGVRGVEIGSVMFGHLDEETGVLSPADLELVRLAVPRRVYSHAHLGYVVEVLVQIRRRQEEVPGLCFTEAPRVLRHFNARFAELSPAKVA